MKTAATAPFGASILLAAGAGFGALLLPQLWPSVGAWVLPILLACAAIATGARRSVAAAAAVMAVSAALLAPPEAGGALLPSLAALALASTALVRRSADARYGRFQAIVEHSELLTLVLDQSDRVSYANPAFLRTTGAELDAIVGTDPAALFQPADRDAVSAEIAALRRSEARSLQLQRLRLAAPEGREVIAQFRLARIDQGPERDGLVLAGTEVTGRVQAEDALAGTRTRLASLFETSRDALMISRTADGVVVDYNDACASLTGWPRDEGVGRQSAELVRLADPEDLPRILGRLEHAGEITDFETVFITRSGQAVEIAVSGRLTAIDDEDCVVAVLRDITENRRTEMALAESEEKFSRIFHDSPDAMAIVRVSDGVVIDVNERFARLVAREHADIVGHAAQTLDARLGTALLGDGEGAGTVELELASDTRRVPTLVSTTRSEIHGEPCSIALVKDMSELEAARAALSESEARFRGAFEHAPIGMMLLRSDGTIGQVNRMLCELLGHDEDALRSSDPTHLVPAEDRDGFASLLRAILDGEIDDHTAETRYLRADGSEIWTNRHVVAPRSEAGAQRHLIVQLADITALKESRERMEKLAFYDTLTGLANRRLFSDRLEQAVKHAVRTGQPTALMYLDLDNFKRVNDSLGHEAGDELLRAVAGRLGTCVREEDTVGRFGGDEFTILLNQVRDGKAVAAVARKVLESLAEPIMLANHEFRVTTSIGVTIAPDDGTDPQTLTKNADLAMYRAKERGRDNYQFFSEDMNTRAMERLILENELRAAIDAGEFELYYQPQVRVDSTRIIGMEALVRWRHPKRGLLAPDAFIHVAEESGLIVPLGEWTLHEACRQIAELRRDTRRDVQIAVNLSARQFADPGLMEVVRQALAGAGLSPEALELEITETMLMHDIDEAISTLEALHTLGVSLAVDDFGTGYSSLNYLKRLPIDRVKVDRTFVSDIPHNDDDVAITAAVIAMAHQLNLAVVAEGVETQDQLDFLVNAECELAQGYLFGPPLPYGDAEALVGEAADAQAKAGDDCGA